MVLRWWGRTLDLGSRSIPAVTTFWGPGFCLGVAAVAYGGRFVVRWIHMGARGGAGIMVHRRGGGTLDLGSCSVPAVTAFWGAGLCLRVAAGAYAGRSVVRWIHMGGHASAAIMVQRRGGGTLCLSPHSRPAVSSFGAGTGLDLGAAATSFGRIGIGGRMGVRAEAASTVHSRRLATQDLKAMG
eukprot:CAMPEP_0180384280 /NCGR_PEP_ID=MMETSP0989-20121125/28437_1 /TAXON_ID=697907 /ORGANISM="non described non described, Strain CCMP2293" /LENGTH=183 /DNA_ID=CAMNT_0022384697 /DNA_START=841 /DNA_END=1389 /DNA_ORIENTATION=-